MASSPLLELPIEILERIVYDQLITDRDINAVVRTHSHLRALFERYLYGRNVVSDGSPRRGRFSHIALEWAVENDRPETLLKARAMGIVLILQPLFVRAVHFNSLAVFELLVRIGDIGGRSDACDRFSALAVGTALWTASRRNNLAMQKRLIELDSSCAAGPHGSISLDIAIARDQPRSVELLLSHGADPNCIVNQGQGPLGRLAQKKPGKVTHSGEIAFLLLQYGADITATDEKGWSPLVEAAYMDNLAVAEVLFRRHHDEQAPPAKFSAGKLALQSLQNDVEGLLDAAFAAKMKLKTKPDGSDPSGSEPNGEPSRASTAVDYDKKKMAYQVDKAFSYVATRKPRCSVLRFFLTQGMDPNGQAMGPRAQGMDADDPCLRRRPVVCAAGNEGANAVRLLAEAGADLDLRLQETVTRGPLLSLLGYAIKRSSHRVVEVLLAHGTASFERGEVDDETHAVRLARERGEYALVKMVYEAFGLPVPPRQPGQPL